jgi:hypothetical protein
MPSCFSRPVAADSKPLFPRLALLHRHRGERAVTLVEVMISLFVLALVMLGLLANFIQSRRVSESSVLHAAATALVYGLIEQVKQLDYVNLLPNYETDPAAPNTLTPPYIRLRINQNTIKWVQVRHTAVTDEDATTTTIPYPKGPLVTPGPSVTAANVVNAYTGPTANISCPAIDNFIGNIPLSTVTGTTSQQINLNLWVWIDEITNKGTWAAEGTPPVPDTSEVKKITIIYTYSYQDGGTTRTVRDREVILRTRFDQ